MAEYTREQILAELASRQQSNAPSPAMDIVRGAAGGVASGGAGVAGLPLEVANLPNAIMNYLGGVSEPSPTQAMREGLGVPNEPRSGAGQFAYDFMEGATPAAAITGAATLNPLAAAGAWWDGQGQRALANNSASYLETPSIGQFMREWSSIYESHSGERGIFNREASQKQAAKNGRRDATYAFGTNPCSEIILRPYQFCNLSSCIIRSDDDIDSISRKIRLATILGTFQASLTDFPYLRKIWQKNTEEEALLGVSMTGICDNTLLNNPDDEGLPARLEKLRDLAVATNAEFSNAIGINQSVAVTAIKPEGTVSQLCSTASGIHPQHSKYYIRRVRADNKDPLTQFMIQAGFVAEPCVMKPDSTTVFSFPVAVADGALLREDLTAIQHLRLWLIFQRHYCEHKPSVTISVLENEWMDVGAWTFKHFDEVTGVSFLPMSDHTYKQAPYEDCDEETYNRLKLLVPETIDWDKFKEYDDNVEGVQTLSCTAGGCEI